MIKVFSSCAMLILVVTRTFCFAHQNLGWFSALPPIHIEHKLTSYWSLYYTRFITSARIKKHLIVLASDEYEGRSTGQRGQKLAAAYLANAFAYMGMKGPMTRNTNPYYQNFSLLRTEVSPASTITIGGRIFCLNKDFYALAHNLIATPITTRPIFIGYGISTPGYADFNPSNPALKRKDVIMLLGEPQNKAGQPLLGKAGQTSRYGNTGFTELLARGPALFSLTPRFTFRILRSTDALSRVPQDYGLQERISYPGSQTTLNDSGTNIFFVSPEMGAALLGTTISGLTAYEDSVKKTGKSLASPFHSPDVRVHVWEQTQPFDTENVLGFIEGSDKKHEVVVISAHYDHIGIQNGYICNGADDDGSGTAGMLAIARAFALAKKQGHGPRRSILFLANVGEEIGLFGSQYYTDHPVFPLSETVANLNLDMIGRVDSLHQNKEKYIYLIGDNWLSTDLRQLSEATNRRSLFLRLDYRYNNPTDPLRLYYRSDHYNFAKNSIPSIYYFSGLHRDYHRPSDDVDKIDFKALAYRSRLVFQTAWAIANRSQRIQLAPEEIRVPIK